MSYQRVVIVGNVGREPELRYTPNGVAVIDLNIAVNRKWKDAEGEVQERTTWYRATVWRRQAETVAEYVKKGQQVLVESSQVIASPYLDKEGKPAASLDLTADRVVFLRSNGGSGGQREYTDEQAQEFAYAGAGTSDDIPY